MFYKREHALILCISERGQQILTIKAQITATADDTFFFNEKNAWHFMQIVCLAEDAYEMSFYLLWKKKKKKKNRKSIKNIVCYKVGQRFKGYKCQNFLTRLCQASHERDIGKQCRPRSDAAVHGVWAGFTLFALQAWISIKHGNKVKKITDTASIWSGPVQRAAAGEPTCINWLVFHTVWMQHIC